VPSKCQQRAFLGNLTPIRATPPDVSGLDILDSEGQTSGWARCTLARARQVRYYEVNSATNGIFAIWAGRFVRSARHGLGRSHSD
jgi:hypothetical protein